MPACVTPKHAGEANNLRENQKKGKPGTDSEFNNWRHWSGCGQGVGDFASYSQKPVTPPKVNTKKKTNTAKSKPTVHWWNISRHLHMPVRSGPAKTHNTRC